MYKERAKLLEDNITNLTKVIENARVNPIKALDYFINENGDTEKRIICDYRPYMKLIETFISNLLPYSRYYQGEHIRKISKLSSIKCWMENEYIEVHKLIQEKEYDFYALRCLNKVYLTLFKELNNLESKMIFEY